MDKVIPLRRAIGDVYDEGADYVNFAIALLQQGYEKEAKRYAEQARPIFEKLKITNLLETIAEILDACES
jgi:hypothetical protein